MQEVTLPTFLKIAMAKNEMTQKEVCQKAGKSNSTLSIALRNQTSMRVDTLMEYLEAMGERLEIKLSTGESYIIKT